ATGPPLTAPSGCARIRAPTSSSSSCRPARASTSGAAGPRRRAAPSRARAPPPRRAQAAAAQRVSLDERQLPVGLVRGRLTDAAGRPSAGSAVVVYDPPRGRQVVAATAD